MTDIKVLEPALVNSKIQFEQLYRIELERFIAPAAGASEGTWEIGVLIYDLHDRTLKQITSEISGLLKDARGRWRIQALYWSGTVQTPTAGRHVGRGESFLYSTNPRGDVVLRMDPPIEIDLGE